MQQPRLLEAELALALLFTVPVLALEGRMSANETSSCRSLEGAALLWSKANLRFNNVGEDHGTNEVPEIFADLVCSAGTNGRPIIVGLEMNSQSNLDAYFDAPDRAAAERRILGSDEWKSGSDGRTSKAMLALLAELSAWRRQGLVKKVVAISVSRMEAIDRSDQESLAKAVLRSAQKDLPVFGIPDGVHALFGNDILVVLFNFLFVQHACSVKPMRL